MINALGNRISVDYQRDNFVSYMIIQVKDENIIIDYQAEMITNNRIPRLLQADMRRTNNETYFYYDITSKVPLSQYLNRKRVTKEELIEIMIQITETMLACSNFLLYNECMILEDKYIYINPAIKEVNLLYLPFSYDFSEGTSLKNFIINLIVYSANIDDESTSDNFIHKILNYVKCDTFNIADFNRLLLRIYNEKPEHIFPKEQSPIKEAKRINIPKTSVQMHDKPKKSFEKQGIEKSRSFIFVIICAVHLIILMLLILNKDFLYPLMAGNEVIFLGVGLIVIALDLVVFRNMLGKKKERDIEIHEGFGQNYREEWKRDKECSTEMTTINDVAMNRNKNNINGTTFSNENNFIDNKVETESEYQYNTVLLTTIKIEKAFLNHTKNGIKVEIPITGPDFLIGRLDGYVDHIIQNNAVGKVHAQIITRSEKYYIKDLNSKNGTFLNEIQIESNTEYEIVNDDKIAFANSYYEFKVY